MKPTKNDIGKKLNVPNVEHRQ